MTRVTNSLSVEFTTTITLTEMEIHALEALVGYGADAFLELFKKTCGVSYIRGAEDGIKTLFHTIARDVAPVHKEIQEAKKALIASLR